MDSAALKKYLSKVIEWEKEMEDDAYSAMKTMEEMDQQAKMMKTQLEKLRILNEQCVLAFKEKNNSEFQPFPGTKQSFMDGYLSRSFQPFSTDNTDIIHPNPLSNIQPDFLQRQSVSLGYLDHARNLIPTEQKARLTNLAGLENRSITQTQAKTYDHPLANSTDYQSFVQGSDFSAEREELERRYSVSDSNMPATIVNWAQPTVINSSHIHTAVNPLEDEVMKAKISEIQRDVQVRHNADEVGDHVNMSQQHSGLTFKEHNNGPHKSLSFNVSGNTEFRRESENIESTVLEVDSDSNKRLETYESVECDTRKRSIDTNEYDYGHTKSSSKTEIEYLESKKDLSSHVGELPVDVCNDKIDIASKVISVRRGSKKEVTKQHEKHVHSVPVSSPEGSKTSAKNVFVDANIAKRTFELIEDKETECENERAIENNIDEAGRHEKLNSTVQITLPEEAKDVKSKRATVVSKKNAGFHQKFTNVSEMSSASDSDDSYFDRGSLVTSSEYRKLIGSAALNVPTPHDEEGCSDSESEDEVEKALARAVKSPSPQKMAIEENLPVSRKEVQEVPKQSDVNSTVSHTVKRDSVKLLSVPASSSGVLKTQLSKASRKALGLDSDDDVPQPNLDKAPAEDSSEEFDFYAD